MRTKSFHIAALFLIVGSISACRSSNSVTEAEDSKSDISWLVTSLENERVFIRERGPVGLNVPAFESTRLLLNEREVLDVFEFEYVEEASSNAYTLANMNPGREVYLKESLVVVRFSSRDTGLSQTLFKLLGGTL